MPVLNKGIGVAGGRGCSVTWVNSSTDVPPPSGTVEKIDTVVEGDARRTGGVSATIGSHMIFLHGNTRSVESYTKHLVRGSARETLSALTSSAVATSEKHVLLCGGILNSGYGYADIDVYDSSLVKIEGVSNLSKGRYGHAETYNNGHFIIAGGYQVVVTETYSDDLVKGTINDIGLGRQNFSAETIQGLSLFSGGNSANGMESVVKVVDSDLVEKSSLELSVASNAVLSAKTDNHIMFYSAIDRHCNEIVNVFDTNLVRTVIQSPSLRVRAKAMCACGTHILIGGGWDERNKVHFNTVNYYDKNLTLSNADALKNKKSFLSCTSVDDVALFGFGSGPNGYDLTIDVYKVHTGRVTKGFSSTIPKHSAYSLDGGPWIATGESEIPPYTFELYPEQKIEIRYPDYFNRKMEVV